KPDALLRFKNEFRALTDIQHPNLVSLGELFEDKERWFFTMEMVDGVHFLDYIRRADESRDETANDGTAGTAAGGPPSAEEPTADVSASEDIGPSTRRHPFGGRLEAGADEAR